MNIYRCKINDPDYMIINANGKIFKSFFCEDCGNYLGKENKSIRCMCDKIQKIYKYYQTFIEEISDIADGDELEDYIEDPTCGNRVFVQYIYKMVLFGEIYDKPYYNYINNVVIIKILNYII